MRVNRRIKVIVYDDGKTRKVMQEVKTQAEARPIIKAFRLDGAPVRIEFIKPIDPLAKYR